MTDIEKRARELLAVSYERHLMPGNAEEVRSGRWDAIPAMGAIRAALTPPEGFVLVPVDSVKRCACGCHRYCFVHCGTELGGLAACPEVP